MDKFSFICLWDAYRGLLTPTQQEITDLYFNLDLTLSEIAEQKGISRQGVSECLKVSKAQMEEYESKLHAVENMREYAMQVSFMMTAAQRWIENFRAAHPQFGGELQELEAILARDYEEDVKKTAQDAAATDLLNKDYTPQVYGRSKTGEE